MPARAGLRIDHDVILLGGLSGEVLRPLTIVLEIARENDVSAALSNEPDESCLVESRSGVDQCRGGTLRTIEGCDAWGRRGRMCGRGGRLRGERRDDTAHENTQRDTQQVEQRAARML